MLPILRHQKDTFQGRFYHYTDPSKGAPDIVGALIRKEVRRYVQL